MSYRIYGRRETFVSVLTFGTDTGLEKLAAPRHGLKNTGKRQVADGPLFGGEINWLAGLDELQTIAVALPGYK